MNRETPVALLGLVNAEAETTVLAAMRANVTAAVEMAQALEPDDFVDPRRSMVFEAMRAVLLGVEPMNDDAVMAELRRVQRERKSEHYIADDYLSTFDGGDLARASSYAAAVKRLAWLRGAGDFAYWLVEELQTRPDPEDLFAAAQERWQLLQPKTAESRFVYGWDTVKLHADLIRERVKEQTDGTLRRFDWPWASWNSIVRPLRPGMLGIIAAPDGQGKCLGKGTKVVMYDGTLKVVEDVIVGDLLMGPDSTPRKVTSLGRGRDQMYWIHQKGGISYRVNSAHILALYERKDIWQDGRKVGARKEYVEIAVNDAIKKWSPIHMSRYVQGFKRPIDWQERPVPIPPYMLGVWLGDGSANQIQFQVTSADMEVVEAIHEYADEVSFAANGKDYQATVRKQDMVGNAASTYSIGFGVKGARSAEYKRHSPVNQLRALGIHVEKHIPLLYKANSRRVRLELLAGLIDADGWYQEDGKCFQIGMINERLMNDIKFIADSLGYRTHMIESIAKSQNGTETAMWRLSIVGDCDAIPTKIARKQAEKRNINKDWRMWAIQIEPDIVDDYYGFQIDGDGLFLLEDMTVTHNTTYLEMIAEHWVSRGIQTVYVHLEDELGYKLDRRAARHAMVALDKIEDGTLTADERDRLNDANRRIGAWADGLHYLDAAGESMTSIVRELESRVAEGVCEAVVFDYLDKVQASRGQAQLFAGNTWERQANDMEQLKTFAEKHKIPVLTATQGNKQMQAPGVQTRQAIQGSGQKSHKAQLVVILTRDLVGADGLKDRNGRVLASSGEYSPVVKVRIDKQNRGKTGNLQQFMVGQYFAVRDIAKGE